ncbi:DUF2000 domain-containing protein [Streptomyces sp. B1I3]|uniref:DUF2000 domain-containing protein n=1 Tax=Streptomyces sp. B1I3 TaxID=3042264 RepID=UPI002788F2D2|nr:DUF2000 domain-containing protein [Streptomyces sp. B1I3]MDQ0794224.1 hypothetical protein [Streptomyces sp. B1I3]
MSNAFMTPEITGGKCAVVVSDELPPGLRANAASVLTMTLGHRVPGLIGPDVKDADGTVHPGIVLIPVPVLTASNDRLREIWELAGHGDVVRAGFSSLAQSCRTYDEYTDRMSGTATQDLDFAGVAMFGPRKQVNKIVGSLPLMR